MNAMSLPKQIDTPVTATENLPTFDARDLIADGVQARLVLDGQFYFLRITRAGKLILTK